MRLNRLFVGFLTVASLFACHKDNPNQQQVEIRDKGEQAVADDEALRSYLGSHFYNYEEFENPQEGFDYSIKIDTIAGDNADKTSILDSDNLVVQTITEDDVDYSLYILKAREGAGDHPKFSDSTLVSYEGNLLNDALFDSSGSPVWFDNTRVIKGFGRGITEFGAASNYSVNDDNTIKWTNDYGIGALFIPSGLGYFASGQPNIPAYSPLIFKVNLYRVNEADHDNDGIPSWMEDLDEDKNLLNDDSDGDNVPNFADPDDDGDGTPTRKEITINEDGSITFPDSNNNGIPDYLDPDTFSND
ncbi:MAG: FKBP-type peptidyl-prolyl cis-trans isomerase [Salegentibacter sp.]